MAAIATAGMGFLLAVLWFDLMHDVQVRGHESTELPEPVLASIGGYYRRVTTDASPMGRLVGVVMLATLASLVVQLAGDVDARTIGALAAVLVPVSLAMTNTFPAAVRLGAGEGDAGERSRLAREIFRDHVACLSLVTVALALQLSIALT